MGFAEHFGLKPSGDIKIDDGKDPELQVSKIMEKFRNFPIFLKAVFTPFYAF